MPVHNSDIERIFREIADLLEIEGANQYRVRAYRTAASTVGRLSTNVKDLLEKGEDLTELHGIGEDLAGKIKEIVDTGTLEQLKELEKKVDPELADLMKVGGLGPKRVRTLHETLGISTLEDLKKAARQEHIREIEGFGTKTEHQILEDIERVRGVEDRTLLSVAEEIAQSLEHYLGEFEKTERVAIAGSYRRRKETVGDLDIVAVSTAGKKVIEHFVEYEDIDKVLSKGKTRSTVLLRSGMQIDLRVVPKKHFGAALFYFTGSRSHNLALRREALEKHLKLNEYGVYKGNKLLAGKTEKDLYKVFDLPYIEPELRENNGEFDAALNNELPELVSLDDIRGDMQSHTTQSDGNNTLEEMAHAAKDKGYEYLAITDHSKRVGVTTGLDSKGLRRQMKQIDSLNKKFKKFRVLKSIEVDILEDGSLDLLDDILEELDIVVCSIHSKLDLPEDKQTERYIRAMDNPYCTIIAHPTERRIKERNPMNLNMDTLMKAAKERNVVLEINAQPDRLDMSDVHCRMAVDYGVRVVISTDAHRTSDLDFIRFGVDQARRGWVQRKDVLNTRTWKQIQNLLRRQ